MLTTQPPRHRGARLLAVLAVAAGLALAPAATASAAPGGVTDAVLRWSMNRESHGGAFAGGCNFFSAGTAGSTGSSRPWTEADGFYSVAEGNVSLVKPDASGNPVAPTWATKCQARNGTPVSPGNPATWTETEVVISGGTGTVDPDANTASIEWDGSWTIVFYGGYTYWTASDPVLTVNADGTGQVTATFSGYGASMENPGVWVELEPVEGVLANLTGVDVTETGLTVTPNYLGVTVNTGTGTAQLTSGANWGAFPQSFVDFQFLTGQSSYWYSSGGSRDAAKPTTPLTIAYTITDEPDPEPEPEADEQVIEVTIPEAPVEPTGELIWEIEDDGTVELSEVVTTASHFEATGTIDPVKVIDSRNPSATWTASGQVSAFTGSAGTIPASSLGWSPTVIETDAGATAGAAAAPGPNAGDGLSVSQVLGSTTDPGAAGTTRLGADLLLQAPLTTPEGSYTATLTLTVLG